MFSSPMSAASQVSFKQRRQKLQPAGGAAGTDLLQTRGSWGEQSLTRVAAVGAPAAGPGAAGCQWEHCSGSWGW